mmetsp:Transcript_39919/g.72767  ORF Transcript_39919/g.72767 Transcript_39919/m.72767 type:complete len:82 (-) Transcript_39919:84-329(-)
MCSASHKKLHLHGQATFGPEVTLGKNWNDPDAHCMPDSAKTEAQVSMQAQRFQPFVAERIRYHVCPIVHTPRRKHTCFLYR